MAKKKIALAGLDTLLKESVQTNQTVSNFETKTGQQMERGSYPLDQILPDPDQPRDVLTLELYDTLFQGESAQNMIAKWLTMGQENKLIQDKIDKVVYLANTIQIHGLINPITIAGNSNGRLHARYLIVTGERRYWAHQYLRHIGGTIEGEPVRYILARVAEPKQKTAVQLIENLARERLNVYETARAISSLKEEMGSGTTWGDVEEILQISRSYRTRILRVLKLTDQAVDIVQQHDLTERAIRPVIDAFGNDPKKQNLAFARISTNLQTDGEPRTTQVVAQLSRRQSSKNQSKRPTNSWKKVEQFNRYLKKEGQTLSKRSLSGKERQLLQEIADEISKVLEA